MRCRAYPRTRRRPTLSELVFDLTRPATRAVLTARQQGREEGARQATVAMLFKLLGREFGSLSEADRQRVEQASLQQLQTFVDRALTASRIEDVLG